MSGAKSSWKATPKAKVYEAMSAVADGRVTLLREGEASVRSSDNAKTYTVVWNADRTAFGSNDNASYWVGYIGYPIIATLLTLDAIKRDRDLIAPLAGVNWNKLNDIYKRRYDDAVEYVLTQIGKCGGDVEGIRSYAELVFKEMKTMKLGRLTPPGDPPKR
jgi:hypothetical protein